MIPPSSVAGHLPVLIGDDEPPTRRPIPSLLSDMESVRVCGEAANGSYAITMIRDLRPDLILLHIQLPVATGIEVVETIRTGKMPLVIFITAYHEHAIRAC